MPKQLERHARLVLLPLLAALTALLLSAAAAPAQTQLGAARAGTQGATHRVTMRTSIGRASSSQPTLRVVPESPANRATVSGTIAWKVNTSGPRITRVDFAIDGTVRASDTSAPFTYGGSAGLNTTKLSNGVHKLTATAYATGAKPASAAIQVTVSNNASAPPPIAAEPAPSPSPKPTPPAGTGTTPTSEPTPTPPVTEPAPTPEPEPETPEPTPGPAPESPAPEQTGTPSASRDYWGAWIGEQLTGTQAPWDMGAVSKFAQMTGKSPSVVNFSGPFANCSGSKCSYYNFPTAEFSAIRSYGAIPFYSWGSQSIPVPSNLSEPNFQLSDVIAGTYDSYIRKFAEAAKAWGHPFFLRFNWEMNGSWFAWSEGVNGNKSGEYVTAWRHVHDIFTEVGATNATWVWCPNVDPEHKLQNLASLYPGNEYVDWTGLDGYNWGTNPTRPDRWRTFDQLYSSTYKQITETIAPGKPMMVSEVGSTEDGGSKATWIKEMLNEIPVSYPKIRGLLWFEKYDDGMDWPIETSSSATSAFASGIQSPAYAGNEFASLGGGPVQPPS